MDSLKPSRCFDHVKMGEAFDPLRSINLLKIDNGHTKQNSSISTDDFFSISTPFLAHGFHQTPFPRPSRLKQIPGSSNTAKRMPVHLPKTNRLIRPSTLFPGFPEISLPIDFEPCRLYF